MSLKSLINDHFSEQPINNRSNIVEIKDIFKENIGYDIEKVEIINKLPTQQISINYGGSELFKIELTIPYSEYNTNGFYYVMKCGDVKEIPKNKAMRLIEQGFAIGV